MRQAATQMRVRDLIIAVAFIGLLLGHLTHLFRSHPGRTRVTIRVFNKTSENIEFLRYQWTSVAGMVESHGENAGTVAIAPGGRKSFRVSLPGPVDFDLSCTTPWGRMTSGPVRIDIGDGRPGPVDFYVRPNGVVMRGMTGSVNRAQPGATPRP
jgi:hypothetical protein